MKDFKYYIYFIEKNVKKFGNLEFLYIYISSYFTGVCYHVHCK